MKKIFSFLAAVLFAGSMMAESITITPAEFKSSYGDNTFTVNSINFASSGAMYNSKGTPAGFASKQFIQFRKAASGAGELKNTTAMSLKTITIATQNDKPFTLSAGTAADALTALTTPEATNGTYACQSNTGEDTSVDVKIYSFNVDGMSYFDFLNGANAQYIAYFTIEYVAGDTPVDPVDPVDPVTPSDTLTCAQAAELAAAGKTDEVIVKGYVTEIAYAWASGSMSFWMADAKDGGKVFEAYKCAIAKAEDAVIVGDLVAAKGSLTYYAKTSTPELAAGCTVEILEAVERPVVEPAQNLGAKTIAEFLELKNTKDTCILTGVVSNITNATYGNFDLIDKTDTIYVYGLLTPEGESKKFADLNVAEKDTLTVLAIYSEHNGKPQAKDAIFVEVKKAPKAPAQDIEITLSSLTDPGVLIWTDAVAEDGWWQIMGGSDAYGFSISNVSTTETAGVYTVDDLDPDYSYISIYGEKDTVDVAFESGSVTVAISNEGVVTVKGTLVGSDGNNYIFDLTYKDPVAEKTVNINITNAELSDYTEMYTMFGVAGEDADKNFVQFYIESETIAGEYTEEDLNVQYTGIMVGEEVPSIFSATIKVVANANGSYTVTATVLCYNNTLYNITMTVPSDTPEGVDAVNATVKALKSIVNGQLVIEKAGVRYNAQGAVIR
jgi:hypothetical protein